MTPQRLYRCAAICDWAVSQKSAADQAALTKILNHHDVAFERIGACIDQPVTIRRNIYTRIDIDPGAYVHRPDLLAVCGRIIPDEVTGRFKRLIQIADVFTANAPVLKPACINHAALIVSAKIAFPDSTRAVVKERLSIPALDCPNTAIPSQLNGITPFGWNLPDLVRFGVT